MPDCPCGAPATDLIASGYKEYRVPQFKKADAVFQKCIYDDKGKRYFINVYQYFYSSRVTIEFDAQFITKQGTLNLTLFSKPTIEGAEELFAQLWETLERPYYELYEP